MRILLIDNDHKITTVLRQGLEAESFAVEVQYDVDAGLHAALTSSFDLIVLDCVNVGREGSADICKTLRRAKNHTPILLLTANDKDRIEVLNAGADDYVVKPFAFEEVLTRVRVLLRQPQDGSDAALSYKDLSLDAISYEVRRHGKSIRLSRREFALLEYLLRNAGQLLPKETIIRHVWDLNADVLPNTVEVYVGYLRNKIDKPFKGAPLINTVRGYGYRLGNAQ